MGSPGFVWIEQVLASDRFAAQRRRAGRTAPAPNLVRAVLNDLVGRSGRGPVAGVEATAGLGPGSLSPVVPALRRVLNVDGYDVLSREDGALILDVEMLGAQFDVVPTSERVVEAPVAPEGPARATPAPPPVASPVAPPVEPPTEVAHVRPPSRTVAMEAPAATAISQADVPALRTVPGLLGVALASPTARWPGFGKVVNLVGGFSAYVNRTNVDVRATPDRVASWAAAGHGTIRGPQGQYLRVAVSSHGLSG